jgi:hypothetical protein
MASPFRVFRKNQKIWMVALTILSMFAFVVLGSFSRLGSPSGKREDPEIFTWDFGAVHKSDLQYRKQARQLVRQFLFNAVVAANPDSMVERNLQQSLNRQFPLSDQQIVESMLWEKKAQQLGIVVSDDMVNNFIRDYTGNRLRPEQLAEIVRSMQARNGEVSQTELFDALRTELSALYAEGAFAQLLQRNNGRVFFFRGDTPGDRWDYFCRLNRKITAELLPVPVEQFVAAIHDPSADELQKFYDQYKNVVKDPDSPAPGFRQPFKAKFQYLKADYEKLLAVASPKITEAQIKSYYDEHKDEFKKTKLPELPSTDESGSKTEGNTGAAKPADETKSSANKSSEKSSDTKSADGKTGQKTSGAKSDAKPNDAKSGSVKSGDAKSGDAKKTDDLKKSDDKKSSDKNSNDGKQSSAWPANSRSNDSMDSQLLALADQPTSPPAAKSPSAAAKPAAKTPDTKSAETSSPKIPVAKASDTKTSETKTSETKTSDNKTSAGQTAADQTAGATPESPVEYDPLSKVTDTIRNRLAQQNVDEQVDAAFSAIELQLDQYTRSLDSYQAALSRGNKSAKKPEPPDLATLAKPYGLEAKETDLISRQQALDHTDIGKSYSLSVADSALAALTGQRHTTQPFVQMAFNLDASSQPTLAMYQSQRTADNDNSRYLWWKVSDEAEHTPPLDEIKPQVTQEWKSIQARTPALAKAQEDAVQARQLKQTLKETFGSIPGQEISTVGPFSWLTQPIGQPFGAPHLTDVSAVQQAGNDFMKAVFALQPGETGVAYNEPQTVYYVAQVESQEPPLDELRQDFMAKMGSEMASIPYAAIGAEENIDLIPALLKQVKNEFGFQLAPGQTLSDVRTVE